jgi:hypothetical protein
MTASTSLIVYLMRGLPGCGKSHRARQLAGASGVVLETDQYFYDHVGFDPTRYDFDEDLLPAARAWILSRMRESMAAKISPIVVDRGNGLNRETCEFAKCARDAGYELELAEPDSPWWNELRVLLKCRQHVADVLFDSWAQRLSDKTKETHRVPATTIRNWMRTWRHDLTIDEILSFSTQDNS